VALHKKLQDVFNWYVDTIRKEKDPDLYRFSPEIEKKLKDSGLSINSAQFINKVFEALEYPSKAWVPVVSDLLLFFDSLPDRLLKDKWKILTDYVPKSEWGRYNKEWARATSSFVDSLNSEPLILIEEDKNKNLIFSVFLGDITSKLGITTSDLKHHYDDLYESVEKELGYTAIKQHIPDDITVVDWPNASVLANAKYEFLVKPQKDPAIADIKNSIVVALNKIGF